MTVLYIIAGSLSAAGFIAFITGIIIDCSGASITGVSSVILALIWLMVLLAVGSPEQSLTECAKSTHCTATETEAFKICNTWSGNCTTEEHFQPEVLENGTVVLPRVK